MKLVCGKCHTEQEMEERVMLKGTTRECSTMYCPNCKDQISPGCCKPKSL